MFPSYQAGWNNCFVAGFKSLKTISINTWVHFLATSRYPSIASFKFSLMTVLYFSETRGSNLPERDSAKSAHLIWSFAKAMQYSPKPPGVSSGFSTCFLYSVSINFTHTSWVFFMTRLLSVTTRARIAPWPLSIPKSTCVLTILNKITAPCIP